MPLSLPTPDLHHFSCIYHSSPFTSITHNHPSLLLRHSFFIQCSLYNIHPSKLWPSSQPHTSHIRKPENYKKDKEIVVLCQWHIRPQISPANIILIVSFLTGGFRSKYNPRGKDCQSATKYNTMLAQNMHRKYQEINLSETIFPRTKVYYVKKDIGFDSVSYV